MDSHVKAAAVVYFRTSSQANVDGDSVPRQRDAVQRYAQANGIEIVGEFNDPAVSGADPVTERPGFNAMLAYLLGNGARTILVENASRFARDLAVQIAGHDLLKARGITLVPVDAPNHFQDETPTATMVRSILGAVSQFEKEALVLKLRKARDRKRQAATRTDSAHRCEGSPKLRPIPVEHVQKARELTAEGKSLRGIAAALEAAGMLSHAGKAYKAGSIARMLRP